MDKNKSELLLTIAVCTYQRFEYLKKCLKLLNCQTLDSSMFEIIVIDNSLQFEKSRSFKKKWENITNLSYIITQKAGLSYARNVALNKCKSPIIAYIDDDSFVEENYAETLLKCFDRYPCAGVIGGKVKPKFEKERPAWLKDDLLHQLAVLDWGEMDCSISEKKWLVGANIAYRSKILKIIGGFTNSLGRTANLLLAHEELAVNTKISNIGYDVMYCPSIEVNHVIQSNRIDEKWFLKNTLWEGASRYLFEHKIKEIDLKKLERSLGEELNKSIKLLDDCNATDNIIEICGNNQKKGWEICSSLIVNNKIRQIEKNENVIYIVTPSYNSASTIDQSILSIISQEGNFSIRYHIQDGGSTDGTLEKIKKWEKILDEKNTPIISCRNIVFSYNSEPDTGMYDAIKKGFESMYIPPDSFMTWLNADDLMQQRALAIISKLKSDLLISWVGGTVTAYDDIKNLYRYYPVAFPTSIIRNGLCDGKNWQCLQQEGTFWRKRLWDKVEGINTSFKYAGDWDLWRRFAEHEDLVQFPTSLALFQIRNNQLSSQNSSETAELNYNNEINKIISSEKRKTKLISLSNEKNLNNHSFNMLVAGNGKYHKKSVKITKDRIPHQAIRYFIEDDNIIENEKIKKTLPLVNNSNNILNKLLIKSRPVNKKELDVIRTIQNSGLFYYMFYVKNNPDIAKENIDPLIHYVLYGGNEDFNPNTLFESSWYLKKYPEVAIEGHNPLYHYIKWGQKYSMDPGPKFSTKAYLNSNPDVAKSGVNPLFHYLKIGAIEGRPLR